MTASPHVQTAVVAAGRTPTAATWTQATGVGRVHLVHAAEHITGPELPAGTTMDLADVRKVQHITAPAATVVELPHASVVSSDGVVLTRDGCVVEDLIRRWGASPETHPVWHEPPTQPVRVQGTAAVVAARGAATNFSHFLADTLPRIGLVHSTGIRIDTWLVSSIDQNWQRDGLRLAGVPVHAIVPLDQHHAVRAENLVVPSPTGFAPTTAPWARHQLRRVVDRVRGPGRRRILVSRASAQRRRLRNETALAAALADYGFDTVDLAALPLSEQVALVQDTSTIVAVHGAGLAHLLHAPAGGHVIELAQPRHAHPEYWRLAALAGWHHDFVPAWSSGPGGELNEDVDVDIDSVIALAG